MRINKRSKSPFRSMLEVLVGNFLQYQDEINRIRSSARTRPRSRTEAATSPIHSWTSGSPSRSSDRNCNRRNAETNTSVRLVQTAEKGQNTEIERELGPPPPISDGHGPGTGTKHNSEASLAEDKGKSNSKRSMSSEQEQEQDDDDSSLEGPQPQYGHVKMLIFNGSGHDHRSGKGYGDGEGDGDGDVPQQNSQRERKGERAEKERSPSRINSLRNSMSEDFDDAEDSGDHGHGYTNYASAGPSGHSKPSSKPPKTGKRANSTALLLHSPTRSGAGVNPNLQQQDSEPNALETKQNLLAQATLSAEENEIRQLVEAEAKAKGSLEQDVTLEDIEDYEDFNLNPSAALTYLHETFAQAQASASSEQERQCPSPSPSVAKTLDAKTWNSLKTVVFGSKGSGSLEGWIGQGFTFNQKVPLGLVQRKGGPCGVLSALQSLMLKNLLFGSEYFDDDRDSRRPSAASASAAVATNGDIPNLDDNSVIASLSAKRMLALVAAIAEILWKCARVCATNLPPSSPIQVHICLAGSFSATSPAPEVYVISLLDELKKYVRLNLHRFDCIGLVYSVVLTRGLERVQEDMDFPNSPLLGQHGYCTQELINLLTIGKAISNCFDNEVNLGDKTLKGISAPVDIGLLSLFEHYDSCQVGNYLKNPKFPIWIVCSESHFSVLFSNDASISRHDSKRQFNLYYYDGLVHQDQLIKLTIIENGRDTFQFHQQQRRERQPAKPSFFNNNMSFGAMGDEDSSPPLEKCIRTKWKNAAINWNDAEPIL